MRANAPGVRSGVQMVSPAGARSGGNDGGNDLCAGRTGALNDERTEDRCHG